VAATAAGTSGAVISRPLYPRTAILAKRGLRRAPGRPTARRGIFTG
jgi:hypothetical protein